MIRIDPSWTSQLLELQETGMGYQIVELSTTALQGAPIVIVNADRALDDDEMRSRFGMTVERGVHSNALARLASHEGGERVRLLHPTGFGRLRGTIAAKGTVDDAVPEMSARDERFLRFSAFADDRRILQDGTVLPGTYVTSYADGSTVTTGTEAVARYALPNPAPAVHRFHLKPPQVVRVRRGTVQPANGQPGGGDEVVLDDGAPKGTRYQQDTIPAI